MDQPATTRSLSEAVVSAVADAEGLDPLDLDVPLYEAIDPDALDKLFSPLADAGPTGRVVFEYCGHAVAVTSDGTVDVADGTGVPSDADPR